MASDREKLIELILKAEETVPCYRKLEFDCDRTRCPSCEREAIADNLIANGVTFATDKNAGSKWISVEDEMPHAEYGESDNVLTINRVGICKVLYFDGGCWCYPTGEPVSFGNPRWRITHWIPLPEAPKVQEVPNGTDHV